MLKRKERLRYCKTPAVTQGVQGPLQSPSSDAPGTAETADTNHNNSWLQQSDQDYQSGA